MVGVSGRKTVSFLKIYLRKELPDAFRSGEVQDFGDCRVIPGLIELQLSWLTRMVCYVS